MVHIGWIVFYLVRIFTFMETALLRCIPTVKMDMKSDNSG